MKTLNKGNIADMNWWVKLGVIYLSLDVFIIATAWYAATVIKERWPGWWKRVVVDDEPGQAPELYPNPQNGE